MKEQIQKAIDDIFESLIVTGKRSELTDFIVNHLQLSIDDFVEMQEYFAKRAKDN